jgi:hypothetical protein
MKYGIFSPIFATQLLCNIFAADSGAPPPATATPASSNQKPVSNEKITGVIASNDFADVNDVWIYSFRVPAGGYTWKKLDIRLAIPGGNFEDVQIGTSYTKNQLPEAGAAAAEARPIRPGDPVPAIQGTTPSTTVISQTVDYKTLKGIAAGDLVELIPVFTKDDDHTNTEYLGDNPDFVRVDHYRPYWDLSIVPMIARPDHTINAGGTSLWKVGVAAGIDYRTRIYSDGFWGNLFNTIEPSIGVHGAIFNQSGSQAVEYGMGGQVSFLKGWVTIGSGFDFSNRGTYYFVGLNLMKLAQSSPSSTGSGSSSGK